MIYIFDEEIDDNNLINYFWFNYYFYSDGYYFYYVWQVKKDNTINENIIILSNIL